MQLVIWKNVGIQFDFLLLELQACHIYITTGCETLHFLSVFLWSSVKIPSLNINCFLFWVFNQGRLPQFNRCNSNNLTIVVTAIFVLASASISRPIDTSTLGVNPYIDICLNLKRVWIYAHFIVFMNVSVKLFLLSESLI